MTPTTVVHSGATTGARTTVPAIPTVVQGTVVQQQGYVVPRCSLPHCTTDSSSGPLITVEDCAGGEVADVVPILGPGVARVLDPGPGHVLAWCWARDAGKTVDGKFGDGDGHGALLVGGDQRDTMMARIEHQRSSIRRRVQQHAPAMGSAPRTSKKPALLISANGAVLRTPDNLIPRSNEFTRSER